MMRAAARFAIRLFAALVIAAGAGLLDASKAQQPAPPNAKTAPLPNLDADALKIPDDIHRAGGDKFIADKTQRTLPPPSLPNKVDLGKYDLEFKASHSKDVNPRTGFDSGEKSNLSNSAFGRKSDPALPNYFGLKLSAPVQ
ncbi:MAG: hypothetical protein WCG00_02250 [Hyphomicrobiales bacterium]